MKRMLVLEDGTVMIGKAFGSEKLTGGEVVFNTGMTGYQELLSDPSYAGQIVTMTYPLIGNYGINRDDFETMKPAINGLIVREACRYPSNWRSEFSLHEFLKIHEIPGLEGVDTRKLTRIIRRFGTLKGRLCSLEEDPEVIASQLSSMPEDKNVVQRVSTKSPYASPGRGARIVLVDFGMKYGILRELTKRSCDVIVVPYNTTAEEIRRLNPEGVLLSNGPGDPKDVQEAIEMIKGILGHIPILGICLGHQLLALAGGADTVKMKFGHRGSNHPVQHLETGKVYMTSQNHSYAVDEMSLEKTPFTVTHKALNDGSIEGIKHNTLPAFSVQYHPEASPGPEDANEHFDDFLQMVKNFKRGITNAKAL
ncbi:carbamoyl phosphate synthase small subunit [Lottiidibacillus patelloidae]|uniref:Carbamoyl phosphate synthase small chain n=1 Tax=Lottiidibacillus patelloidae TaxID=2670334 RepID=A0A263BZ23_9BACI|nr:carbamoyl phosphate synthase small subunit [Lottiidibacillus patelloidae]OZM58527.1 carbamoyl phosphate synthase small subunit [Lottiidibacillus patelloidae]